jgi:hypothetical protein
MDDAGGVNCQQCLADLSGKIGDLRWREAVLAKKERNQVLPVNPIHRNKKLAFCLAEVMNSQDVGILNPRGKDDFSLQLQDIAQVGGKLRAQDLYCNSSVQLPIQCTEDPPHAALAD